jgi:hypothetical protein
LKNILNSAFKAPDSAGLSGQMACSYKNQSALYSWFQRHDLLVPNADVIDQFLTKTFLKK